MELSSPITIYWDLPAAAADPSLLLAIAAGIIDCRPLMLNVTSTAPTSPGWLGEVLERFRGGPAAVTLTITPQAHDDTVRALVAHGAVRELFLDVDHADLLDSGEWQDEPSAGVSYAVTHGNWRELPTLVHYCLDRGITRLVLPMQRLYGGEPPFFLTMNEQRELANALDAEGGARRLALTIHDPFLWRAFNPGVPFPQGGCQAANTMIAIAPDGGVYPCPTLPVRLGTAGEMPLQELIASEAKKALRRRLLEHPRACGACGELAECRGGCRGRAYVMHQSLEGEDPSCW